VHDLVDCKWRDGRIGMRSRVGCDASGPDHVRVIRDGVASLSAA
jgi:hypothetical protein